MALIDFRTVDGDIVSINPNHVSAVYIEHETFTAISMSNGSLHYIEGSQKDVTKTINLHSKEHT